VTTGVDEGAPRLAAKRVLVIRLGALGDVVRTRFAFPALRELYPDAEIDWLVEDRAAVGLEGIVGLDHVVTLRRRELRASAPARLAAIPLHTVRELRARGYDLAIDFHGILKSALLAWGARVPQRVGYAAPFSKEGSALLYTHRVAPASDHLSRFERNAELVAWLGGRVGDVAPPLELPPGAAPDAALPDAFYVIHPGTSPGTIYKRWPAERYAAVAKRLADETGVSSLVTWGPVPGEREYAETVVSGSGGAARLAPATDSIAALLALLRRGALFVGGDSGPLHLAALAGLPLVVVFGPTDPVENAPFAGAGARVLRRDVGCNPCREGCPARTCLAAVTSEEVFEAALELL
jgi:ADP-heptose:LPS heptosyltransferase